MSAALLDWYKNTRRLIEQAKGREDHENVKELYKEWTEAIETMEIACPDLKRRYEQYKAIQESFTREQIDFICWQIGDWYIEWENKMWVDGKPNQHWLGVAKEQLKTMVCGD